MKRQILLLAALCITISGWSQVDSTTNTAPTSGTGPDTLHIGTFRVVRDHQAFSEDSSQVIHKWRSKNNINWLVFDFGFTNYTDNTNYGSAAAQQFAPGATKDWFNLRQGKSIDVNIWLFLQDRSLIKNVVNLRYGFGVELNNYRYTHNIVYRRDPTKVIMDTIGYSKNKLAADYFTVPLMLNFNLFPKWKEPWGFSAGLSAGYKYSSRQKLISQPYGKQKIHDDFDMEPWKISWIGELVFGSIRMYGSLATKSMFKNTTGIDQVPYTLGIRLSNL